VTVSTAEPGASELPVSAGRGRRLRLVTGGLLAAALGFTWWRLWRGADLVDEGFSVLVPWRWALGDRPFVDEQNLAQAAGLLSYPFFKLYALVGGGDSTAVVMYGRHLYLVFAVLVAALVYVAARRLLRPEFAACVAAPFVTILLFETPQLTANSMGAGLLAAGAALGAVYVTGGRRRYAFASGLAFGFACVAYPTVLFTVPFTAVFLAFSVGRRAVAMVATGAFLHPPDPDGPPTGPRAWRAVSAWSLGGALVIAPPAVVVVLMAGTANLQRSWDYTLRSARDFGQLAGASKAVDVAADFFVFAGRQWYLVLAAAVVYVVYRQRPRAARWALLGVPAALWLTGTTSGLGVAGAVIAYALAAPYLYLFVAEDRREGGARVLLWVWAPALVVGAMTAYTSSDGFEHAAVGLFPALFASGLFLAWSLEAMGGSAGGARCLWRPLAGLAAVVVVTLAFQFQFQQGGVSWADLDRRVSSGPWWGIAVSGEQHDALARFAIDLQAQAGDDDALLVYPRGAGYYLYWPGAVAANTYQLMLPRASAPLPASTLSYYRRHQVAPTVVVRLEETAGVSRPELEATGGFGYEVTAVSPWYAVLRRPAGESVDDVLARLPRQ